MIMKKITLYRISKDLVDKYGVGVETNKNYEKVRNIANFYYSVGKNNPSIVETHNFCWDKLILPIINNHDSLNWYAYPFYIALALTLNKIPVIMFSKCKTKSLSEERLEKFIVEFSENYDKVINSWNANKTNNTSVKDNKEVSVYFTDDKYLKDDMEQFLYGVMVLSQEDILRRFNNMLNTLLEMIPQLIYLDISEMEASEKKLNTIKRKIEDLFETRTWEPKGKRELTCLDTIIRRVREEMERGFKSDIQLEIEEFMMKKEM